MRRLRVITPEEQRILDGGAVDKAAYTARAVFLVYSIPLKRAVPKGFLFFSRLKAKDGKKESGLFRSGTELQNTSVFPPKKNNIRFEVLRRFVKRVPTLLTVLSFS